MVFALCKEGIIEMSFLKTPIAAAAAIFISLANTAEAVEGYIVEIGIEYEIMQVNAAAATALGMPLRGTLGATLEFVKPECLIETTTRNEAAYYASGGIIKLLNKSHNLSMVESAYLSLADDQSDRFDLHLRLTSFAGEPFAPLKTLTISNSVLPPDAVPNLRFPTNGDLIRQYWQHSGTQAYFATLDPANPSINLGLSGIDVEITRVVPNVPTPRCR